MLLYILPLGPDAIIHLRVNPSTRCLRFGLALSGCRQTSMPGDSPHSLYSRNDPAIYEPFPPPVPYYRHQSFMRHTHPVFHPPHTIYVPQQQLPAPQSHKVWILDCKSCGTFFTNRGMKVGLTFLSLEELP